MNHLLLTRDCLDVAAINILAGDNSCGAISLFVGTTRDNFDGKQVLTLEYEAYEPMALKQMESICEELRRRWNDIVNVVIYHRLGLVAVGEASVVIAISSPHRQSALDGISFAIEELKKRVPIWKKELYHDTQYAWKENKELPRKRDRLDFNACDIQDALPVPRSLVQIAAEEQEINRRIQCFVEKKREEIDLNNILDFTKPKADAQNTTNEMSEFSSCARTDSFIVKQEHSKCHLRVRRVDNRVGPQTGPNYLHALDKLMGSGQATNEVDPKIKQEPVDISQHQQPCGIQPALQERLGNIEQYLDMPLTKTKHIFERIKAVENRILHLESISPEYKHFLPKTNASNVATNFDSHAEHQTKRKTYSVEELNAIIEQMQNENDWDKDDDQQSVHSK